MRPFACVLPQAMANATSDLRPDALVVYSRAEGEMIMRQVANIKMPLRGVYITGASSWTDPDNEFAEYVVTPGQWAADVRSSCTVFGTNENYVKLFTDKYGYEPDYKVAMSTAAGVVFQLALQQAGTAGVGKIMEALSLLSAETIAGRVRFSYQQRNIGRNPILMQYQVCLGCSASSQPMGNLCLWVFVHPSEDLSFLWLVTMEVPVLPVSIGCPQHGLCQADRVVFRPPEQEVQNLCAEAFETNLYPMFC